MTEGGGDNLRSSPRAVLALTRRLCAEILLDYPGTHFHGCTGNADEVEVELTGRFPLPAPGLAEVIEHRLTTALHEALGPGAPAVWVRIIDLAPPG